jgi:phospholipid/cholesterol/gamma-HCH transport system substrate-binding protein
MKPFRERNPIPIGAIGLTLILGMLFLALNAKNLPFLNGGKTYYADFADAAGLKPGDDVRVAGVKVGDITSVGLDGAKVRVGMRVSGVDVGSASQAAIKIKTLLGEKYVALTPQGTTALSGDIQLAQTQTPLDVTQAFMGLGQRAGEINTHQLGHAFNTIAAAFKNTPPYVKQSLNGLRDLSQTISSRDAELQALLAKANDVTDTIASRDAEVAKLINDSNLILQTVYQQRAVIHQLLVDTTAVTRQLSGLVRDNQAVIGPALNHLNGTLDILRRNQADLDATIHLAAPFIRDFTDVLGNGRWFETVLWNLPGGLRQGCLKVGSNKICPPLSALGAAQ